MPRVLLATIGNRDPLEDNEPTGPLRAARVWQPEVVILVAGEGVADRAEHTRQVIRSEFPAAEVIVEIIERLSPNVPDLIVDIDGLLRAGRALVYRYRQYLDARAHEVAVCFTSGTPQAGTAMTLVARSLIPGARHFQALAPAKASDATRLLREFEPDVIVHLEARDRMFDALARGDTTHALTASETIVGLRQPPWNAEAVRLAHAVALALRAAEDFRRHHLSRPLETIARGKRLGPAIQESIESFRDWSRQCEVDDLAWGTELAASAHRIGNAASPTLGVIAAAVASEVLISARLRTLGADPDRLFPDRMAALPAELEASLRPVEGAGFFRIEGGQRRSQLLALRDSHYREAAEAGLEAEREALATRRNRAVHQGVAASREDLEKALAFLDRLAGALGARLPSALPTAPSSLAEFVQHLRELR